MAIVSKIRERAGLAVTVIALSMILFIVGGDLLSGNSRLRSWFAGDTRAVGEIAGADIDIQDYQNMVERLDYTYRINNDGKAPDEQTVQQVREQAWTELVTEKLLIPEYEKAGVKVTDEEIDEMVMGEERNIHPSIKQAFVDPQTGQFNRDLVRNFLSQIEKAAAQNPEAQQQAVRWALFEQSLPKERARTKFEALLTKSAYVTKAEAKREYSNTTTKANASYVFVNYFNLPDSTVKVEDSELKTYLNENRHRYRAQESRSIQYVQFTIQPSEADRNALNQELESIKADFASAADDSVYARSVSDDANVFQTISPNDLPAELSAMAASLQPGQVYGPFANGDNFVLYKVKSIENTGEPVARASHILFQANDEATKAEARKKAQDVLKQIQTGAMPFEVAAAAHGSDGTKDQGGDLGWFGKGRMVPEFEKAIFGAKGPGLLPNLVETQFGVHIVKVTGMPNNTKYKVSTVKKKLEAGDDTREAAYNNASRFRSNIQDQKRFEDTLKNNPSLEQRTAYLQPNGSYVNDIASAREVIRWAFNDAKKGEISKVFELNDRYLIAMLTKKTSKDDVDIEDIREALTSDVRKTKKAELIKAKLKGKTLEEMKNSYGNGAVLNTQNDVPLSSTSVGDFGFDPVVVGRLFGLKQGAMTAPFNAESGVGVLKLEALTPAPEIADYAQYKQQIESRKVQGIPYYSTEAIKEVRKVNDNRVKFY